MRAPAASFPALERELDAETDEDGAARAIEPDQHPGRARSQADSKPATSPTGPLTTNVRPRTAGRARTPTASDAQRRAARTAAGRRSRRPRSSGSRRWTARRRRTVAAANAARPRARRARCPRVRNSCDAQVDEVGRTDELEREEQPLRRAQDRAEPERGQHRVADQADAHARGGGHARRRALRDRARHHEDHVLPRRHDQHQRRDDEQQPRDFDQR